MPNLEYKMLKIVETSKDTLPLYITILQSMLYSTWAFSILTILVIMHLYINMFNENIWFLLVYITSLVRALFVSLAKNIDIHQCVLPTVP